MSDNKPKELPVMLSAQEIKFLVEYIPSIKFEFGQSHYNRSAETLVFKAQNAVKVAAAEMKRVEAERAKQNIEKDDETEEEEDPKDPIPMETQEGESNPKKKRRRRRPESK